MVKYSTSLDATFAALADPTRRGILKRLSTGVTAVSDIAKPFSMSLPAITKHLRVLERAGLVHTAKQGRVRHVGINAAPLRKAGQWIEFYRGFWESNLDSLARYLESEEITGNKNKPARTKS